MCVYICLCIKKYHRKLTENINNGYYIAVPQTFPLYFLSAFSKFSIIYNYYNLKKLFKKWKSSFKLTIIIDMLQ